MGFSLQQKAMIIKWIRAKYGSVVEYCKHLGISKQYFYRMLSANEMTTETKDKLFKE